MMFREEKAKVNQMSTGVPPDMLINKTPNGAAHAFLRARQTYTLLRDKHPIPQEQHTHTQPPWTWSLAPSKKIAEW
jgi:hypothetical protein